MACSDALAPDGSQSGFPIPQLLQLQTAGGGVATHEGPVINGIPMPGQWLLTRVTREFGWQQQQANFMRAAPTSFHRAIRSREIEYSVAIWENAAALQYRALLSTVLKKPVTVVPGSLGSSAAMGINDPSLKDIGVTNVVVKSVTPLFNPLVTSGGKGPWTAKVTLLEYREPVQALPLPDQTIPDPGAEATPSATVNNPRHGPGEHYVRRIEAADDRRAADPQPMSAPEAIKRALELPDVLEALQRCSETEFVLWPGIAEPDGTRVGALPLSSLPAIDHDRLDGERTPTSRLLVVLEGAGPPVCAVFDPRRDPRRKPS